MGTFLADLRYGLRRLRGAPGFAVAAILTVALGVAGPTYVFTEINAFYLRPLHVSAPDQLVTLTGIDEGGRVVNNFQSTAYEALASSPRPLLGIGAHAPGAFSVSGDGLSAQGIQGRFVSGNFFALLGGLPAAGRFFAPAGETEPVAVISHHLWQRRFDGDPRVIGRAVRLSGHSVTVVGVAPEGFNGVTRAVAEDVWLPLSLYPQFHPSPVEGVPQLILVQLFGRLPQGGAAARAESGLTVRVRALSESEPALRGMRAMEVDPLTGLPSAGRAQGINSKTLHLATALLLLIVASTNVAGMLLARASARRKEIGVRIALGASRSRVISQLTTESLIIFVLGGAGGVLLTWMAGRFRATTLASGTYRSTLDYGLDARVLGFALASSLLVTAVFGLVPAVQTLRAGAVTALRDTAETGGGASRLRGAFVAFQIAACVVLLAWAGLFSRAMSNAWLVNPGFDPAHVAVVSLDVSQLGSTEVRGAAFLAELVGRVAARPDVREVAVASSIPFGDRVTVRQLRAVNARSADVVATASSVSPDYFRLLRIPLRAGRAFTDADREGAAFVVIVSEGLAKQSWPGENAIGKRLAQGPRELEVVGVVGDVRSGTLTQEPGPAIYTPFAQDYSPVATVLVRSSGGAGVGMAAVKSEVGALEPGLPIGSSTPLRGLIEGSLAGERMAAVRIGAFGLIGLFLSAVGLYAALSYLVARRTREIGIRLAVGARAGEIVWLFLGRGMRLAALGVAAGVVIALLSARLVASRLYGLPSIDAATLVGGGLVLLVVSALASYLPARRAAQLDPLVALRTE